MGAANSRLTSYGDAGFSRFIRMAFARHMGLRPDDYERPVMGSCDMHGGTNRCHTLCEIFTNPTTILYRNLAAMDTEEMSRTQPLDGVILLGGCDTMTPAQLMGAASADVPTIQFTDSPMNDGEYEGKTVDAPAPTADTTGRSTGWQGQRGGACSDHRILHGDGQREHIGTTRRSSGDSAAGCRRHPGQRQSAPDRRSERPTLYSASRRGWDTTVADHDAEGLREGYPDPHGRREIDERDHTLDCDRWEARGRADAGEVRRDRQGDSPLSPTCAVTGSTRWKSSSRRAGCR